MKNFDKNVLMTLAGVWIFIFLVVVTLKSPVFLRILPIVSVSIILYMVFATVKAIANSNPNNAYNNTINKEPKVAREVEVEKTVESQSNQNN